SSRLRRFFSQLHLVAMFANSLERSQYIACIEALCTSDFGSLKNNIVYRQNANHAAVAADDRKTPHSSFTHGIERSHEFLLGSTEIAGAQPQIGHTQLVERLVMSTRCDADIAIGDHTDQLSGFVDDRQSPAIVLEHYYRDLRQVCFRCACPDVTCHQVLNFH